MTDAFTEFRKAHKHFEQFKKKRYEEERKDRLYNVCYEILENFAYGNIDHIVPERLRDLYKHTRNDYLEYISQQFNRGDDDDMEELNNAAQELKQVLKDTWDNIEYELGSRKQSPTYKAARKEEYDKELSIFLAAEEKYNNN